MGRRALGFSSGFAVKVGNELPGPHRIKAWRPGVAMLTAWGIAATAFLPAIDESIELAAVLAGLQTAGCKSNGWLPMGESRGGEPKCLVGAAVVSILRAVRKF